MTIVLVPDRAFKVDVFSHTSSSFVIQFLDGSGFEIPAHSLESENTQSFSQINITTISFSNVVLDQRKICQSDVTFIFVTRTDVISVDAVSLALSVAVLVMIRLRQFVQELVWKYRIFIFSKSVDSLSLCVFPLFLIPRLCSSFSLLGPVSLSARLFPWPVLVISSLVTSFRSSMDPLSFMGSCARPFLLLVSARGVRWALDRCFFRDCRQIAISTVHWSPSGPLSYSFDQLAMWFFGVLELAKPLIVLMTFWEQPFRK